MPTYPGASASSLFLPACAMSVTSGAVPIPCRASRAQDHVARRHHCAGCKAPPAGIVELDELKVAVANHGGTAPRKCGEARVMPVESIAPKLAGAFEEWHEADAVKRLSPVRRTPATSRNVG